MSGKLWIAAAKWKENAWTLGTLFVDIRRLFVDITFFLVDNSDFFVDMRSFKLFHTLGIWLTF